MSGCGEKYAKMQAPLQRLEIDTTTKQTFVFSPPGRQKETVEIEFHPDQSDVVIEWIKRFRSECLKAQFAR